LSVQCGVNANSNGTACALALQGADIPGGTTSPALGGTATLRGGNIAGTGASDVAGNVTMSGGNIASAGTGNNDVAGSVTVSGGSVAAPGTSDTAGSVTVSGGGDSSTSGSSHTAGSVTVAGGNCTGLSTGTCSGGNVTIAVGTTNAASGSGTQQGIYQLQPAFIGSGTIAVHDAVCYTATDMTVQDCPTSTKSVYFAGCSLATATPVNLVDEGYALCSLDSGSATVKDIVIISTTSAGKVHDNGTTVSAGFVVGIVVSTTTNGAGSTLPLIKIIRFYAFSGTSPGKSGP